MRPVILGPGLGTDTKGHGTPATLPITVVCGTAEAPVVPAQSRSVAQDEASRDLVLQQEVSLSLERHLSGAAYELVSDPVPLSLLSRARLVLAFSRVGFDRRLQVATWRVLQAAVAGGVPGPAHEHTVWAERHERGWELVELQQALPPPPPGSTVTVGGTPLTTCDSARTTNCIWPPVPIPLPLPRPK